MRGALRLAAPLEAAGKRIAAEREARRAFSRSQAPPILIYQMGKVGSATVYRSLQQAALPNPVLHLHFLSGDLPEHRETHIRAGVYPPPYHIYLGEAVRRLLNKNPHLRCKIITLVRDPIAFVVSNLFQNPQFIDELSLDKHGYLEAGRAVEHLHEVLRREETFRYVYQWFDKELKRVFSIDVFSVPFPRDTGYAFYRANTAEALLIRLEDLSQRGPTILAEFLDAGERIELFKGNVRKEAHYDAAIKQLHLDRSLCREIYSSQFVRHFYDEEMIQRFIEKWS